MTEFRRQALIVDSVIPNASTNAGLWLDKYLLDDKEDAKKNLIKQIVDEIKISAAYKKFYDKWKDELTARQIQMKNAETQGRLALNLGADSVLENSIALNRTYGVPYIPGSALKGLAASYARTSIENFDAKLQHLAQGGIPAAEDGGESTYEGWDEKIHNDIFGTQDSAGYVTFYDALLVPNGKLGLVTDVVTVHHQEYYQKENVPPADWDSPIPIHFLSVVGTFSIAIAGPASLVKAAFDILYLALKHEGIGAKTNSGYGRMEIINPPFSAKDAVWKKAKVVSDGRAITPVDAPTEKLRFYREYVLPKGYTPANKADVDYAEEILADGNKRVWVKQLYFSVE